MDYERKYKSILKEMAFTKNQIEQEIRNSDYVRLDHLVLCFYLKDTKEGKSNIKHWMGEIQAQLMSIAKRKWKNNNKYLKQEDYFLNLWKRPFENNDNYEIIDITIQDLIFDGYSIPSNWKTKKDKLVKTLRDFYYACSILMSEGKLNKKYIYDLIETYIL